MNTLRIDWPTFHADALTLAKEQLRNRGPFRGILAISRGGLIPAAIVAYALDVRVIDTISIKTYGKDGTDWQTRGRAEVIKPQWPTNSRGWLILDDLVDSGVTMRAAKRALPEAFCAAIYAKPAGMRELHTFVREVPQDAWVAFPWDVMQKMHDDHAF